MMYINLTNINESHFKKQVSLLVKNLPIVGPLVVGPLVSLLVKNRPIVGPLVDQCNVCRPDEHKHTR